MLAATDATSSSIPGEQGAQPFDFIVGPRAKLIPFSAPTLVVGAAFLKGAAVSKRAEHFLAALKFASESNGEASVKKRAGKVIVEIVRLSRRPA